MRLSSLQARLLVLLLLLVAAAIAAGGLMTGLFRQSATARVGQANAQTERACDALSDAYHFYASGWRETDPSGTQAFRDGLTTVVQSALRRRVGIEGGIWHSSGHSLAYGYPTYEGSGPKIDLPQAELPRIAAINQITLSEQRATSSQFTSPSQTLLLTACPLTGPIPGLTAWTMTRVMTFAGPAYRQLMTGLAVLLVTVLLAAVLLTRLILSWRRHVRGIQSNLSAYDVAELPTLTLTGERELDDIVSALNDALTRLAHARTQAQDLSRQVATAERLAAIGRVAAGVAHEIRNPIAAMRLKAENALSKGPEQCRDAMVIVLEQIARLDRLLRRLLNVTEPEQARLQSVRLEDLLRRCLEDHRDLAESREVQLSCHCDELTAQLDPHLMRLALDNLIVNAIQAAPNASLVELRAQAHNGKLVLSVKDAGKGPPQSIRERLFEPFVTGRSDGTGLGLSIVREVVEAHGGTVGFGVSDSGTLFEMRMPWQPS